MHREADIAILGLNYPPEPTGIAPYTGGLSEGLQRFGYVVAVDTSHPHYPEWAIREGYGQWLRVDEVAGIRVRRYLHYVPRSPRGLRRLVSEMSYGARVIVSRWNRPRVVIAVSPSLFSSALAALRIKLTPNRPALIVWVQDIYTLGVTETGEGGRLVRRFTQWLESRTLRAADRVVVIHQRFSDFVTSELGVAPSQVNVIRNWTHLSPSDPIDAREAREHLAWPRNATLAVHTGNMGAKQGLANVVEAARIADQRGASIHFVLVGDGGERAALEDRSRGISRLTFVDPLSDSDYRFALAAADVLIVNEKPGVAAMAVPSKLTSYFDAGRPVVAATDKRGITASEIRAAGAGVVVDPGDPAKLLDAVLGVSADPAASATLGSNGRHYRKVVLDEAAAIEQWASVVGDLLPRPGS